MHLSVYLALVSALLLSLTLKPLTRALAPKPAAIVLAVGSVLAGAVWVTGLALLSMATLGRLRPIGELGRWSVKALNSHNPVPLEAGIVSLIILASVAVTLVSAVRRLTKGMREVRRLQVATSGARCDDLAVIDSAAPDAVALPGWPSRNGSGGNIIVTSGMLRALDPVERQVLMAHERCHLRNAHWAYRLATRLGAALLPTSRPLVTSCDHALERWADEKAAAVVGDRRQAATAVARAALATTDHHRDSRRRATLAPAFAEGAVAERVEALLTPAGRSRWGLAVLAGGIAVGALGTVFHASNDLHALFDLSRYLSR